MGDGLLAEFASVLDAVECAVAMQQKMAERNAGVDKDKRIEVRIGVNLGEVIVEGRDRHGEGVNIAARLQQLAEPGGICISGKVAKEVEKKLAFFFEPMGEQQVKNIAEPISVYRVRFDGTLAPQSRPPRRRTAPPRWAAGAVLMLLAGAALWLAVLHPGPLAPHSVSTVPTIAVLPFDNMSDDPTLGYMGDGIAEDIITTLSRFPDLSVIARNSSFTLGADPRTCARLARILASTMCSKAVYEKAMARCASLHSSSMPRTASTSGPIASINGT